MCLFVCSSGDQRLMLGFLSLIASPHSFTEVLIWDRVFCWTQSLVSVRQYCQTSFYHLLLSHTPTWVTVAYLHIWRLQSKLKLSQCPRNTLFWVICLFSLFFSNSVSLCKPLIHALLGNTVVLNLDSNILSSQIINIIFYYNLKHLLKVFK